MKRTKKKDRPEKLEGKTHRIETNAGRLFLTVNRDKKGPFEVVVRIGKAGSDLSVLCEAVGRLVSLSLRHGIPVEHVVKQLSGVGGEMFIPTVPDAIGKVLEQGEA